jgi:hypothetical protein
MVSGFVYLCMLQGRLRFSFCSHTSVPLPLRTALELLLCWISDRTRLRYTKKQEYRFPNTERTCGEVIMIVPLWKFSCKDFYFCRPTQVLLKFRFGQEAHEVDYSSAGLM